MSTDVHVDIRRHLSTFVIILYHTLAKKVSKIVSCFIDTSAANCNSTVILTPSSCQRAVLRNLLYRKTVASNIRPGCYPRIGTRDSWRERFLPYFFVLYSYCSAVCFRITHVPHNSGAKKHREQRSSSAKRDLLGRHDHHLTVRRGPLPASNPRHPFCLSNLARFAGACRQ
jgi:hypothetical protein